MQVHRIPFISATSELGGLEVVKKVGTGSPDALNPSFVETVDWGGTGTGRRAIKKELI